VQPLWKSVWRFLKKKKVQLPCDLSILLLFIYANKSQHAVELPEYPCLMEYSSIAKLWNQPRCLSIDEWIIYIMEFYSSIKKHEIMSFAGK
jgi:hypothetical protein